jgi:hypothetical protein
MMHTRHSEQRMRQRGIAADVLEVLSRFGDQGHRYGAQVLFMPRASREEARRQLGREAYARVADRLDVYLVQSSEGRLITCARRRRRLKFR